MLRMIGSVLIGVLVIGMATYVRAQGTPAQKGAAPGAAPAAAGPQPIPGGTDVLATVTSHGQTDKVTKAEVFAFLSRYPLPPPEEREIAYSKAVEYLVNLQLMYHFLSAQRIQVPDSRVDEQI